MPDIREQLDYLLAVDRLISAADEAKKKRDGLLRQIQANEQRRRPVKQPSPLRRAVR